MSGSKPQVDLGNNTTTFTYNTGDQVETTKDPRQNVTTNVYDSKGNLEKTIDEAGTETTFTCDAQGNVKSQTVIVGGVPHVTSFDYDTPLRASYVPQRSVQT